MNRFSGYETVAKIYESASTIVFRGRRTDNNESVILKVLNENPSSPVDVARYQHEFKIIHSLDLECVAKAYAIEMYEDIPFIVFEDFGGDSLNHLMITKRFSLEECLTIAVEIANAIAKIHAAGIIHKDINPSNIVINPASEQLKIIDFGMATALSVQNPLMKHPNVLEGTLAYMSPEQTGRINRSVDYRTDFYSLGVTLYEMFCRKRPFESDDNLELVHAHIAKVPQAIHKIDSTIPEAISNIIMKLLAKNAVDRYQSPLGIRLDLDECLDQWKKQGKIESFSIAQNDVADKFQIQKKLYGREKENETLMQAFRRVTEGSRELLLVTGAPGIGKSTLVREVHKHTNLQRGSEGKIRFISGKFDRLQREIPYSAVVSAFQELVRHLLSESDTNLLRWRKQLLDALGPNGQIIIDVIPEFELIVGPQPTVATLGPVETRNRFKLVFQNFIRVFCRSQQPLTIFLDDLQWADAASLKLIELMIMDQKLGYLLLIGAYRDNEVDADGPLKRTLDSIAKKDVGINLINLVALDNNNICQMIVDSLHSNKRQAMPLAEMISQKTGGNPFFAEMFLKTLYTQKLLRFDSRLGSWQWGVEEIQKVGINDDVVDLVARKIQQFDDKTQRVLQVGASLGNPFKVETLAKVCNLTVEDTAASLQQAVADGLIVPMGNSYEVLDEQEAGPARKLVDEYGFIHDRIQQTAYSLVNESERQAIHRQVGLHFLENTPAERKQEKIFNIVNQLNLGRALILNQADRDEAAELNLEAGRRAKKSAAFEAAIKYFRIGTRLLGKGGWKRRYSLSLALHSESTEAAYLCADYDEMQIYSQAVMVNAKTLLDKVNVYEVEIEANKAQYKLMEALETSLFVLRGLGIKFPARPKKLNIILELLDSKFAMTGKRIENLVNLPAMVDPYKLASLKILNRIGSAAYFVKPDLLPLLVFRMLKLSLRHGNAPESAFAYAVYGMILCGVTGDIEKGFQYGRLSLRVLEHLSVEEFKARTYHMCYGFIIHWKKHIRETIGPLPEAFQSGLETGDFEYAGFCAFFYCYHSFLAGKNLDFVEQEMHFYSNAIKKLKHEQSFHMQELFRQAVANLRVESNLCYELNGHHYDEKQMLPRHKKANDRTTIYYLYFIKLFLCYLFGKYHLAVKYAKLAESYIDSVVGMIVVPTFYFYDSLTRLAIFANSKRPEQKQLYKQVCSNQKKMKKWAHHAPMNHLHKYYLVEAERHRILGQSDKAGDFYDQAIKLAKKNEFTNEEALANELAARFYLERGKATIARAYMQEAHHCYEKWGALAKVKDLNERYNELLSNSSNASTTESEAVSSTINSSATKQHEHLDLATVMKASQAISGEVVMAELMKQLMTFIVENAGAQKGFLLLNSDGRLNIQASIIADPLSIEVLQSTPIEQCHNLSLDIVRFVFRSAEDLVIHDASEAKQFDHDLYIHRNNPKSILCMPIRQKDSPSGVLYLENNLTTAAFTEDRIKVLRILLSQASISLDNARLYEDLKQEILDRKKAQEDLLRLATAIEQAAEGIVITDRRGTVNYTNPAFEKISDYTQKEIVGQNANILRSDHHPKSFYKSMWKRIATGKVWSGRITTKKKDNTICQLEVTISPVRDSKNNIISFVSVNRDVTREIQMEKELQRAQKMESLGTLAGGVAHDLNNILSGVVSYPELLLSDMPEKTPFRDALLLIKKSGEKAAAIVQDLLTLARRGVAISTVVNLNGIIEDYFQSPEFLKLKTYHPEVECKVELKDGLHNNLGSPVHLSKTIMNLISNAAEAMPDGGTITVSSGNTEIDKPIKGYPNIKKGSYTTITVSDTGVGIAPEEMERIFEPFYTKKVMGRSGTGLGMAVVWGTVHDHNGYIDIKSTPGEGTTFHLYFPSTDEPLQTEIEHISMDRYRGNGESILVVDDVEEQRNIADKVLTKLGYCVASSASGEEAVEYMQSHSTDLVILDMIMDPGMDGLETYRRIIEYHPDQKSIIASGYSETGRVEEIQRLGAGEYIRKPYSIEKIGLAVKKALAN